MSVDMFMEIDGIKGESRDKAHALLQALEMAAHTGRQIFLVHYTCVGERSPTYSGKSTVW